MPASTHGDRLDRLEEIVQLLAEDQVSLQKLIADLATETRRGFDQIAAQSRKTDEQFRETDARMREMSRETEERFRETAEQMRQTNQRVDNMVSAIGELIRTQLPPRS
jgi:ABC-type transporter Mla subunit MlaD